MDEELFEKLEHSYSANNSDGKFYDLYQKIQHKPTVISREIRPLTALYPFPPKKMSFIGLRSQASLSISAPSGLQGRYAHAYGIFAPFYYIILKQNVGGGV